MLGGHFEVNWSVNPHWEADFVSLPDHPITRGVEPFKANDEWYFHLRFKDSGKVMPILAAVAPESTMRRKDGPHSGNPHVRRSVAEGERQTVAWAYERPDGGRSFGFTGGHFHWNWGHDDIRRLVANAIRWTAGDEIPVRGTSIPGPVGLQELLENQDYPRPKDLDLDKIKNEFRLTSTPAKSNLSRELYATPLVTTASNRRHRVDIETSLRGVTDLFLVATDGGDGYACDWVDWIDPVLHGPAGPQSLVALDWVSATSGFGQPHKNANCMGQPWSVSGESLGKEAIGAHANSVIHYRIPKGFQRFTVTAALDTGGTAQRGGNATSVRFALYAGAAPADLGEVGQRPQGELRDPENAVAGLEVGDGLEVTLSASEPWLRSLTNLDVDDRGRVWVCDVMNYRHNSGSRPEGDRILILEDSTGDGIMDSVKTYYQGTDIDSAMGICVLDNEVIVTATPTVWPVCG